MKNNCKNGHERTAENTYLHKRTIKPGVTRTYPECKTCAKMRIPTGKKDRRARATLARELAGMTVVRDDWTEALDCPTCHSLLTLDEENEPRCIWGHSPRAFVQAVLTA